MWRQDDVVQVLVFVINFRIFLVDVEGGPGDVLVDEGLENGLLIDNGAPGTVDQDGRLLHHLQLVCIDHVVGFIRQWAVKGNHVSPLEQFIQRNVFC